MRNAVLSPGLNGEPPTAEIVNAILEDVDLPCNHIDSVYDIAIAAACLSHGWTFPQINSILGDSPRLHVLSSSEQADYLEGIKERSVLVVATLQQAKQSDSGLELN